MTRNEKAVLVDRPNTARATTKLLTNTIPHRRRKVYITLTRDFWQLMALIGTLIILPVLHMALCVWGGVA